MCVGTEGAVAGLEPLLSSSGRPGGREVPMGNRDFLRGLEEFRELPLKVRLRTREDDFLLISSV